VILILRDVGYRETLGNFDEVDKIMDIAVFYHVEIFLLLYRLPFLLHNQLSLRMFEKLIFSVIRGVHLNNYQCLLALFSVIDVCPNRSPRTRDVKFVN